MKRIFYILGLVVSMPALADPVTITSKDYVDDLMDTKQDKFPALNTNTIVIYGDTDGAIGQQPIVTTLGSDTTATTSPTTGAVLKGINTKQNTVNATAGRVMRTTGTAGTLGIKTVYNAPLGYPTSLVTAETVNSAVTTAANNALTCVDNDCLLLQLNTSNLPKLNVFLINDTGSGGTAYCYRRLDGAQGHFANIPSHTPNGGCDIETLEYLGAVDNKSGKWATEYSYGKVLGISVCSELTGSKPATDEQTAILDEDFATQTGNGEIQSTQSNCWCKMTSPEESRWVPFSLSYSGCARNCAATCGSTISWYGMSRKSLLVESAAQ